MHGKSSKKPSEKNKSAFQENRRRYLRKYNMLQSHHIPGLVFLYAAFKGKDHEGLTIKQFMMLCVMYMYKESGENGSKDVFSTNEIYNVFKNWVCQQDVKTATYGFLKKGLVKRISLRKYYISDKGLQLINSFNHKISREFYLFEQKQGILKNL